MHALMNWILFNSDEKLLQHVQNGKLSIVASAVEVIIIAGGVIKLKKDVGRVLYLH